MFLAHLPESILLAGYLVWCCLCSSLRGPSYLRLSVSCTFLTWFLLPHWFVCHALNRLTAWTVILFASCASSSSTFSYFYILSHSKAFGGILGSAWHFISRIFLAMMYEHKIKQYRSPAYQPLSPVVKKRRLPGWPTRNKVQVFNQTLITPVKNGGIWWSSSYRQDCHPLGMVLSSLGCLGCMSQIICNPLTMDRLTSKKG